jgi:hypothetical protein
MQSSGPNEFGNSGLICLCGRSFTQQSALSKHQRACQKSKKRLISALDKAKEVWVGRKKQKHDNDRSLLLPGLTRAPSPVLPNEACFYQMHQQPGELT